MADKDFSIPSTPDEDKEETGRSDQSESSGVTAAQRLPLHLPATAGLSGVPGPRTVTSQTAQRGDINQLLGGGQNLPQIDVGNHLLASLIEAQRQAVTHPRIPQIGASSSMSAVNPLLVSRSEPALLSYLQAAHLQNYLSQMGQSALMNNVLEQGQMGGISNMPTSHLFPPPIPIPAASTSIPFNLTMDALRGLLVPNGHEQAALNVASSQQPPQKRQKLESASSLPRVLTLPEDHEILSAHQIFLRSQIEAFCATTDDVSTHTRGRNKPVILGQVGIRCRHCAHLPIRRRRKGSTYFPASLLGLYQAAQNMCSTHMQSGLCDEMPPEIRQQFVQLLASKVSGSGAGRPYWARAATKLGLVETEDGIRLAEHFKSNGSQSASIQRSAV
ncbi:MAG: hypothetical protein SGBAC_007168 [Bacillariaceae sp.]